VPQAEIFMEIAWM